MRDLMAQRLQSLDLQVYDFRDDSRLHAGHAGNKGGGHYAILLVSATSARGTRFVGGFVC